MASQHVNDELERMWTKMVMGLF